MNRHSFTGVALLSSTGDKDYVQAPFQAVLDHKELAEEYGEGSVFASGLIVHAHNAFDGDLYAACSCLEGKGENLSAELVSHGGGMPSIIKEAQSRLEKELWIKRAGKFSRYYFSGDLKQTIYCLKDVDAWYRWCTIKRNLKPVDWSLFSEERNNTNFKQSLACAGGQCDVSRF
jgi:ribonucleoside-diphosphate reductase alpha chain